MSVALVRGTRALLAHRRQLASLHTYSNSKVVEMAIAVTNLAQGGIITSHKSREAFERALRHVMR